MTKIPQSSPIVKVIDVPTAIGPLRLAFDADGGRWTPLAQISMYCGAPLHLLTNKAENRYWGARTFARVGFCLSVPKLQEFLESTKPMAFFSAGKLADFEWMRSHAARILRNHPECEIPGPRGMESAQGVTPRLLPEDELTPKSNLLIHSMPMPEVKAAPVAELLPIRILPLGEDQVNAISARDLHAFLEVATPFKDWIHRRIEDFGFNEHSDYEVQDIAAQKSATICGQKKEYLLTLDMAKELAMVERNEKGKQARQYFLECERKAKATLAAPKPMSSLEILVAQSQALLEQDRKLHALENKIQTMETRQRAAEEDLTSLPEASGDVPDLSTRGMIGRMVRTRAIATGVFYQTIWNILYTEFRDRYHIDLKAYGPRGKKLKPLDAADELGVTQKLYDLASHLFGKVAA